VSTSSKVRSALLYCLVVAGTPACGARAHRVAVAEPARNRGQRPPAETFAPTASLKWSAPRGGIALAVTDGSVVLTTTPSALGYADEFANLEGEADFDGNGTIDAVVTIRGNGNCCPGVVLFASVVQGAIRVVKIESTWESPTVTSVQGRSAVTFATESRAKGTWGFDGTRAFVITPPTRHILPAIAEVHGAGHFWADAGARSLTADLNGDGTTEVIDCQIWERWGSLLCTLPLGNNQSQQLSTGCDRFGVLAATTLGRHDLVCNDDLVFKFDGVKWVEIQAPAAH
jgi:hypothetical protein